MSSDGARTDITRSQITTPNNITSILQRFLAIADLLSAQGTGPVSALNITGELSESQRQMAQKLEELKQEMNILLRHSVQKCSLSQVLHLAQGLVAADAYAIWALSMASRYWYVAESTGLSESYKAKVIDVHTVRHPSMPHEPVVAEHVDEPRLLENRQRLYEREGIESLLVMPLPVNGGNNATIAVYSHDARKFNLREVESLNLLATISAPILEDLRVFAG